MFQPTRQSSASPTPWRFISSTMSFTRSNVIIALTSGSFSGAWWIIGLGTGFHAWRMRTSGASIAFSRTLFSANRSRKGLTSPRSIWYLRYIFARSMYVVSAGRLWYSITRSSYGLRQRFSSIVPATVYSPFLATTASRTKYFIDVTMASHAPRGFDQPNIGIDMRSEPAK